MSEQQKFQAGTIVWRDLTVENADELQQFYSQVVGWEATPHPMGDYHDYNIVAPSTGEVVTGICNARGSNVGIPPQWLMYVAVDDVEKSIQRCLELGGTLIHGPRTMGNSAFCVIQDPAGAVLGLMGTEEDK